MREIKFRAFNGFKMIYRGLFDRNWYTEHKGGLVVNPIHPDDKQFPVMQFTEGLFDKNGLNYCQDDIVKHNNKNHRLIRGSYAFELLDFYDSGQDDPTDFFSEYAHSSAEIIGNIHENPELLTQHKN